jgi:hypothetical protein
MPVIFAAKAVGTGGGGLAWCADGAGRLPDADKSAGEWGVRGCKEVQEALRTHSF